MCFVVHLADTEWTTYAYDIDTGNSIISFFSASANGSRFNCFFFRLQTKHSIFAVSTL